MLILLTIIPEPLFNHQIEESLAYLILLLIVQRFCFISWNIYLRFSFSSFITAYYY